MSCHWFQRYLLPGFAFKAFVIGGGYATGRELAEFFLPSGPRGGLMGMTLAAVLWSVICIATFTFARATQSADYQSFFRSLLGPAWFAFEIVYLLLLVLVLAVFGAAAGAIGAALFGWPPLAGTLCLGVGIAVFVAFGNASVEQLFKWVTLFLYAVYVLFIVLSLSAFGQPILASLALDVPTTGWVKAGVTYASYNVVAAVVILPVLRHLRSQQDAVIAGALCGPLAMLPAVLFFICMMAFYPQVGQEALPSEYLLQRLGSPLFHVVFQLMIFAALLESGTGGVHAVNERLAHAWKLHTGTDFSLRRRLGCAAVLLVGAMLLADRFGLVALIAHGYRWLAYALLAVYIVPLLGFGLWRSQAVRSSARPA